MADGVDGRKVHYWAIWEVIGIALLVRILWIWNKSLCTDEAAVVYMAQYPLSAILTSAPET